MISVVSDGTSEIPAVKELERDTAPMRNGQIDTDVLEKFIFMTSYSFRKDTAKKELHGEILVAHVAYESGYVPQLFFEKL